MQIEHPPEFWGYLRMRNWVALGVAALFAVMILSPALLGQDGEKTGEASGAPVARERYFANEPVAAFDPHDLNGIWRSFALPGTAVPRPEGSDFGMTTDNDNPNPEPPLTGWGKEHLLVKAISHSALGGHPLVDVHGVPAQVLEENGGQYPGQNCETIAAPAQYGYTGGFPMEIVMAPGHIFQFFERQREWREWWLDRGHPKDLDPTYMGDSVAKWEGDTLVVDTIGFNGKDFFSQNVGQKMSDEFHLIERFRRLGHDYLTLEMTYCDAKAWGDKCWPGFNKSFTLEPAGNPIQEFICTPEEFGQYDSRIGNQIIKGNKEEPAAAPPAAPKSPTGPKPQAPPKRP